MSISKSKKSLLNTLINARSIRVDEGKFAIYNVLLELVSGTSCELGGINFERKVKEFHLAIQN